MKGFLNFGLYLLALIGGLVVLTVVYHLIVL